MPDNKLNKSSYPNYDEFQNLSDKRDTAKWIKTVKEIYFQERNGVGRNEAIKTCTATWDRDEVVDFGAWLKYYEEGSHLKYKKAQIWFEGTAPGYFLPIQEPVKKEEAKAPAAATGKDIDFARDVISKEMPVADKKVIIERQRKKLIGRLDSAEKLLRTEDGEIFAGNELEALIEAIYSLKKKIQLLNKISTSTRIYEDMIVREANVLSRKGFNKAGDHLYKMAQAADLDAAMPPAAAVPPVGGAIPAQMPAAPSPAVPAEEEHTSIKDFLKNMETANLSITEDEEEEIEAKDQAQADDELEVDDDELFIDDSLVVNAQLAPEPLAAPAPKPVAAVPVKPNFVPKAPDSPVPAENNSSKIDEKISQIFVGITAEDVVSKLEEIATIFRTREIPRQLSLVDIMLDHLGLASLFPNLSEAVNKSLESNNYCLTRIEDITSKLRGTLQGKEMNLTGGEGEDSDIKNKLQSDLDKDKARKEKRKEIENAQFDVASQTPKETPNIELEDPNAPAAPAAPTT